MDRLKSQSFDLLTAVPRFTLWLSSSFLPYRYEMYVMLFDEVLHFFEQRNKNQTPNATASSLYNTIGDVVNEAATIFQ